MISTYFRIHQKKWNHVKYLLPNESDCWKALTSSNLMDVPKGEIAILGFGLDTLIDDKEKVWQGQGNFAWIQQNIKGHEIVFIGCLHSYWSDVAGRLVSLLAKLGFTKVIYIGKLGTLDPQIIPNECLATGNTSYVEGEIIHWKNCFDFAKDDPEVTFGDHYSCPSVLYETKEWLERNKFYSFVDPEIGHMAKAALSASIDFSYLHIVSDNLSKHYGENLSNERQGDTRAKRVKLLKKAKNLIEQSL